MKEARRLLEEAKRNKLSLLTTEKDAVRIQSDAALGELAARIRALPVTLRVMENEAFRKLVLAAHQRA